MGLNNGSAKLTAENLRLVMTSPLSNGALALKLGVSHTTVSKIRSGVYRSDETRKYQEVTTLKSEIAQLLEENERLALRVVEMREALKNLAANVKEMAEESFGHPDESFAFSFKENDPSGYFAWEAAEAALAAPPTEAEQRVKEWREALEYYANPFNWTSGDVADHIYAIDDSGRTAREALALRAAKEGSDAGK